jgi:Flagellar hook-length control protein FliK
MIIQSYDPFLALGAPQATPDAGQGETHEADTFAQFLAQDVGTLDALVALLAPFSQAPARALPLDPSCFDPANVDDIGPTEQENRAFEDMVDALQTLLPTILSSTPQAPFAAPVTVTDGVATLSVPQEGVEGQEAWSHTPHGITAPIPVIAAEGAVPVPAGGGQTTAGGDEHLVLVFDANGAATPEAQPTGPESGNAEHTRGVAEPPQGRQANAPTTASPLSISAHTAQEDEVTLRHAMQAEQHGGAHAIATKTGPWQQARFLVSMDTGALMSEETSPVHKVQAAAQVPTSTETVPVPSAAFAEVDRFPLRNGEVRLSAEPSAAADLPVQAQPPGQQAVGSLRYVPVARGTILLQLEPPELGTLLVQVRQVNEQLTASFWAESSDVRSLLQAHFPALNQVLSQQGLAAQQISLHLATGNGFAEQFGQFSQQHGTSQTFAHGHREEGGGSRRSALDSPAERYQVGNGRVDIRI